MNVGGVVMNLLAMCTCPFPFEGELLVAAAQQTSSSSSRTFSTHE